MFLCARGAMFKTGKHSVSFFCVSSYFILIGQYKSESLRVPLGIDTNLIIINNNIWALGALNRVLNRALKLTKRNTCSPDWGASTFVSTIVLKNLNSISDFLLLNSSKSWGLFVLSYLQFWLWTWRQTSHAEVSICGLAWFHTERDWWLTGQSPRSCGKCVKVTLCTSSPISAWWHSLHSIH